MQKFFFFHFCNFYSSSLICVGFFSLPIWLDQHFDKKEKSFFSFLWIPLLCKNCFVFIIIFFFVFCFSSSNERMVILKRPTFKEGSKVSWLGKNPCTLLSMYIIFNNDSYERTFNASKIFFCFFFSFFLSIIKSFPGTPQDNPMF